jgi:hypothetical protein
MVACQGRGVVAATHAGVVSSDDAQGIRRVLAMTEDELTAIEARANAATPGPWKDNRAAGISGDGGEPVIGLPCNVDFVINARTDIPALVAEVRRLRGILDGLLGPLKDATVETYGGPDFIRGLGLK